MKIKYLWFSKYKNLEDITLNFSSDLITLMVGQNGLGKSNLIEILTTIFKDLYSSETKDEILVVSRKSDRSDYIIKYVCKDKNINIELRENSIILLVDDEHVSFEDFKANSNLYLPERIIGYYSGENRRIEDLIKEYASVEKNLQIKSYSKTFYNRKLRKIFFAENFHSQLILLTLAIYKDHTSYSEKITNFWSEYLHIESIDSFRLVFNNPKNKIFTNLKKNEKTILDYQDRILNGEGDQKKHNFWSLRGKVDTLISVLFDYCLNNVRYSIYDRDKQNDDNKDELWVKEYLSLDYIAINDRQNDIKKDIKNDIIDKFPNPLDFFDAIETCNVLGTLNTLELDIIKNDSEDVLSYNSLSEGEQQMVSVIGMMMLAEEDNVLFLFDEPDTHINPKWQRDYVKLLNKTVVNHHSKHIFISTHSPFLVQAYDEKVDLLLFRKDDEKILIDDNKANTIHNWRIDQVLMSPYFDLPSVRAESLDKFMEKRLAIIQKGELTEEDRRELEKIEKEQGFLPTGETIEEIRSMAYINQTVMFLKKQ